MVGVTETKTGMERADEAELNYIELENHYENLGEWHR